MLLSFTNSKEHFVIDDECFILILKHNANPSFTLKEDCSIQFYSILLKKVVRLPRILMCLSTYDKREVDHVDRNKFNNRMSNFRLTNKAGNASNRNKLKGCSSKYKCVSWNAKAKKWTVNVLKQGKRFYGGLFKDEIEAAVKADDLMLELHGEFAVTNFPLYGA